jgi:probable rRNA maturation factor
VSDPDPPSSEPADIASSIDLLVEIEPEGVDLKRLADWVRRLTTDVAPNATSFVVRLAGTESIRELNSRYRGKDTSTDVLSFPGDLTPEGRHLGDVVIAVPVAAAQAAGSGRSLTTELRALILHGLLHCLGYDHETDEGEMEARETALGSRWLGDHA